MKNWMVILILALAGGVWGQGGMLLVGGAAAPPPPAQLLLDEYPGAAAAYSLRKLRTDYTGACVEVRRSLDNTTAIIGFSGNYIDTAALKMFCGVNTCSVRTWYDQSTNGNNIVQTTNARQPNILVSGVYLNYVDFAQTNGDISSGSNVYLSNTLSTSFQVTKISGQSVLGSTISSVVIYAIAEDNSNSNDVISFTRTSYHINGTLLTGTINRNALFDALTGAKRILTSVVTPNSSNRLQIGYSSFNNFYTQEFILYNSNQLSNRPSIETNINAFYSIY